MNCLAKAASVAAALLLTAVAASGLDETLHELTSADGKPIKVQIVRMSDSEVKIRKGRKDYDVPLSKFSKESQGYLKQWAKANVTYSFAVRRTPVKLSSTGKYATYGYEVTLESRSGMTAKDITIKYQIYNTASVKNRGEVEVSKILPRDDFSFKTVAGSNTYNGRLMNGSAKGSIGNHLGGLWLRVYDASGRMLFEEKNLITKVDGGTWGR